MLFQKITIVGVGLLGGSMGLAVRARKVAGKVDGFVRRSASIAECERAGAVDHATRDLEEAVGGADLVVLCTPLEQMRELTEKLLPWLKRGAIVTDVGSVKTPVVAEIEPLVAKAGAHFVGSHPMAGSEKTGVSAARADLFKDAVCVLTPTAKTDKRALGLVEEFWKTIGCRVLRITAEMHDELVSRSSHLPHVVAAELANYVLSPTHPKQQSHLCASGFRDTTRIASGSPDLWRDITIANRRNLGRVLGVFIEDLQEFRHALENGDVKVVQEFFENARHRRERWCGQNTSPE
jgi:prephenate dehydrogenase